MKVTVFGATGGIGRHVVEQARAAGHGLTLVTRDAGRLADRRAEDRVVEGDMDDAAAVRDAVRGSDAVVNALGPTTNAPDQIERFERFARLLVDAMEEAGVRRLVTLSGAACVLPGERKGRADRIASRVVRLVAGNVVEAKQRELDVIRASRLEWVAVRPPRVDERPATGRVRAGGAIPLGPRSRIGQADLARFMVAQLETDDYLRRAPYVSE